MGYTVSFRVSWGQKVDLRKAVEKRKGRYRQLKIHALGFPECLKTDLHGTIFAYDCRMRLFERALLASGKDRIQHVILTF